MKFPSILSILSLFTSVAKASSINPFISSEDPDGIPYLRGPNHNIAEGGFLNDARNIVVSLWVLNDSTWVS